MSFERIPIATFAMKGDLDRLLRLAKRGDRLVFVGTQTDRTSNKNQGRVLGMADRFRAIMEMIARFNVACEQAGEDVRIAGDGSDLVEVWL
ncbi:hypothetical protein IE4771_PA00010 (plasmid) [Rhizobium etli bv. mimosae str. IE4771]|uniref:Uncharacterized protein n=2 Tax=Rhizobium etli TaxID=29449 RepID=A0A060I6I6_RHIET|nr:hypothetical protein IE4771_PA00010 [Rhizobium sp. IE4771]